MSEKGYRAEKRALREKKAGKAISNPTMATVLPGNTSVVVGLPVLPSTGTLCQLTHEGTSEEGAQLVRNNKRKTSDLVSKSENPKVQTDKKLKHQWDFKFASDYSITESPKSVASLLRHFRRPGFKIPMFNQFTEINRENYFRFAGCVGQLLAEYNRAVDSYEEQLRTLPAITELKEANDLNNELTAQVKKMQAVVEENSKVAERVQGSVSRIRRLESKIKEIETERDEFKKKFQMSEEVVAKLREKDTTNSGLLKESEAKCQALIRIRSRDVSASVREVKDEMKSKQEEALLKIKSYLEQKDAFQKSQVRVAEIKANFELLSEIVKGVIADPRVELEDVARDKDEAVKEFAEMIVPELDLKLLDIFESSDSSPILETTTKSPANIQEIDEFGSNMGLLGGLPIDNQKTI